MIAKGKTMASVKKYGLKESDLTKNVIAGVSESGWIYEKAMICVFELIRKNSGTKQATLILD